MNEQLELFQQEIRKSSHEVSEKLSKRIKTAKTTEFKHRGNETVTR